MTETLVGGDVDVRDAQAPDAERQPDQSLPPPRTYVRPLVAAFLSSAAAGMVSGGIFGSWSARLLGLTAAAIGAGYAAVTLRVRRQAVAQLLFVPVLFVLGLLLLLPGAGEAGPSDFPRLISEAVSSGRLLRPPVPFDVGWRPLLLFVIAAIAYGSVWLATAMGRPKLGLCLPLPVVALTAISQPADGEVIGGVLALAPLLIALAVLFSGDAGEAAELGRDFEVKRALRGSLLAIPAIGALIALNSASFLFPKPVYDPTDKPQKPKPIPLSAARDRVLFEVETSSEVTGPWRTGVLDGYDGRAWRLPPFDVSRFRNVPADGVVDPQRASSASVNVRFTVRDLGDSPVLPGLAGPVRIAVAEEPALVFDPRTDLFRVPTGRLPAGLVYEVEIPPYPTAEQLRNLPPSSDPAVSAFREIAEPPPTVRELLDGAPSNPFRRLDVVRKALFDVVIAAGAGSPVDITPARVEEIFTGNHEATPYEIVAAEAMLARWAGLPGRIGFGFDGVNEEKGKLTVRPRNAAQWLEVNFGAVGWVPLIGTPPKAKASLDTDPNARFNPTIEPSDDVAVEVYLPVEGEDLTLLYQRVRSRVLQGLPFVAGALVLYLSTPAARKAWRRRQRRRWAAGLGPRAQVAVEYAEFRDLCEDLNIGDPFDTPLEYLEKVDRDDEHAELAWLMSRAMYGDLATSVTGQDALAAEEMAASLRARAWRGQPATSRILAAVGRASLRRPYTTEIPNVRELGPRSVLPSNGRRRARARETVGASRR